MCIGVSIDTYLYTMYLSVFNTMTLCSVFPWDIYRIISHIHPHTFLYYIIVCTYITDLRTYTSLYICMYANIHYVPTSLVYFVSIQGLQ